MKKIFVLAFSCAVMYACNSSDSEKATTEDSNNTTAPTPAVSDEAALEMIGSLDCTTCHQLHEANIGPSYDSVAAKYENTEENVAMLADKIIKGGYGVWGETPMTPHPDLSVDSAKKMVRYILSLKK